MEQGRTTPKQFLTIQSSIDQAASERLELILEDYCDRIPKIERESWKRKIYDFALRQNLSANLVGNTIKEPTNAQRKKKLIKVAEATAALNHALKDLTAGNYLDDLIRVKSYIRKRRAKQAKSERPFEWQVNALFGGNLTRMDWLASYDPKRDHESNRNALMKAVKNGEIPALFFMYNSMGIAQVLNYLEKASRRQEKRIVPIKGGRVKSSLKEYFVESCAELFVKVSAAPISTTVNGPFRLFVQAMNKLTFDDEGELENEVRNVVKALKQNRGKTLPSDTE